MRSFSSGEYVEVWTPEASWWHGPASGGDFTAAQAANLAKEMLIANPIWILSRRNHDGFVAASLGRGSAEVLEHVGVEWSDYRWTLGVEPRTGLLASVTFRDRGPEGNWGEVTYLFTDYRVVDGVSWPHRRVVTFDGEMVPWWSSQTRALRLNPALPGGLFERPVGGEAR